MATNARAEQLRDYGRSVLEGARSEQVLRMARQVNAVSYTSAREYAGRSLFELLQNGYDAHPRDRRDGQVHVLLDEAEGEWGTLYVANGGTPFTWRNVERICELAQSSKEIGEGIGNKGVGFRSILLISDAPEIYSADPDSPLGSELDGYCFRFAQRADVEEFLGGEGNAHEVAATYPPLQAPLPLDDVPPTCRQLAAQGYVTVVRLPLLSESARAEVWLRMRELAGAKVPVMLFLDRLASLTLERRAAAEAGELDDGQEAHERHELTRSEECLAVAQDGAGHGLAVSCATVDLGPSGTFLVARSTVEKERLNSTLAEAVGSGLLDDTWQEWKRSAVVEVALPLPAPRRLLQGQIYTFLPMGEDQAAPFPGHANAPFFTKFDRTGIPSDNPLNVLLLDAVAETCLAAAAVLRASPEPSMRQLAVDLVSWENKKDSVGRLSAAALRVHGSELADVPLVPVLAADGAPPAAGWAPPRGAALWPDLDLTVLTAHRAHKAGIVVADPEIGSDRLKRLATLCRALACPWEPAPELLADHVERIVGALPLPRSGESPEEWSALYEDLAALFEGHGRVLHDRRLLLAEDCTLRHTNRPPGRAGTATSTRAQGKPSGQGARREAFFQPVRTEANRAKGPSVPSLLGRRLFCLHPGLVWKDCGERTRGRSARVFLEEEGLVRPYDTKGLLDHARQQLNTSTDLQLRLRTLRFVFRLWQAQRSLDGTEVFSLGLYVLSADGRMIRASNAVFGRGWGRESVGEDLASVVAAGQDVSKSLKAIAGRLLAAPEEFAKGDATTAEEWRSFLKEAGVADGLVPVSSPDALRRVNQGQNLTARQLVHMAKVSAEVREQWEPHVRNWSRAYYPRTPYWGTPAWQLPGQDVVGRLGQEARLAYARLVLHGLADWKDTSFTSVWTSAGSQSSPDKERVPTPLGTFVREQPWLPVRGRDRAVRFVRPADAWHCPPGLEEEPSYAPTVDHRLRHLLERGKAGARLREMGLPTWGNSWDSDRLIAALGRLAAEGALGTEDRPAAQRANERAWRYLVQQPDPALPEDASLLAESGDRLISVPLSDLGGGATDSDGDAVLYVSGERDGLTALLVREMGRPLLTIPDVSAEAAKLLAAEHPSTVRHTDDLVFTVTVDGARVDPVAMGEPLVDQLPWLTLAVGVLADHLARGPRASEAELNELMSLVRSVRLHRYHSWDIELDGRPVTLPGRLGGVLPLPDPKHPLVLAPAGEPGWPETTRIVVAVAELLGRREFGDRLRLAAHQLASRHADLHEPGQEELADALEVTIHQVKETSRRIDGAIGVVLERCRPFLVHLLGTEAANSLLLPPPGDTKELQAHLDDYATELPVPVSEFIDRARAARGTDELRRDLGIGFAELNDTLRAMHPPLEPVSHADEHEEALRTYLDPRKKEIVNRLRWAVLEDFDARRPMPDWPSVKALDWITAPEAWAYTVDTADTGSLEAHVEEQLALRLGRPVSLPRSGERLPAPDQVRPANLRTISGLAADLAVLVRAAGRPLPAALTGAEPAEEVTARLEAAGALDFRPLSPADVVGWLAVLGQWPEGMAVDTDPGRHGLSEADLDRVRNAADHERRERERKRRSITVGGRAFDVHSGDYTALTRELDRLLHSGSAPGITAAGPFRFTDPRPRTGRTEPTGRTRGWNYGGSSDSGLTTAQREAIGYVGEWYAYQWLCARYPDRMDETSWVSGNRRKAFPGASGDDGLGYDFRVGSGRQPYLYEVKATAGEGGRFELGESEVRAARQNAGNDRWRLLVVTHALNPHRVAIQMLPNPYGKRGRGRYREEGGALRFSYLL